MLQQLNNTRIVRYLLLFSFAWVLMQVIAYFEPVLIIFVFAAILAFLLNYPVVWMSRFLPRWLAVILVFFLALLIIGILTATLGLAIVSQLQQLFDQAPQILDSAIALIKNVPFLQNKNTLSFTVTRLRFHL